MNHTAPETKDWRFEPQQSPYPVKDYDSADSGRLVSYSLACDGITAMDFLRHAQGQERYFWEDVRDNVTFAGFGVAANLTAWGKQRYQLIQRKVQSLFAEAILENDDQPLATPRLFGGFAFREDFVPDNTWASFHPAHFVLPHYQFVRVGDESWLTINVLLPHGEDPAEILPQLRDALSHRYRNLIESELKTEYALSEVDSLNYPMDFSTWENIVGRAVSAIKNEEMEKVVLARISEVKLKQRVDVLGALDFLNNRYSQSYRFLFEPRPHHSFFGATPELLAKVDGRSITSMAMAGSIGRGHNDKEDDILGNELLQSAKDRHEHNLVVMAILMRLAPLTSQLEIAPQPGVYRLPNIQHLYSPVRGRLLQPDGILSLVKILHPTPALGGSPRRKAMKFISEVESVPRGWYAAPVGWIDHNLDGVFVVAIRSAVGQERRVWLYAGSGIVANSEPGKEWDETDLKFRPIMESLGLDEIATVT